MQSEPQIRGVVAGGGVIASGSGVLEQGGASRQRLQLKHLQLEGAGNEACLVLYVVIVAHPPETLPPYHYTTGGFNCDYGDIHLISWRDRTAFIPPLMI